MTPTKTPSPTITATPSKLPRQQTTVLCPITGYPCEGDLSYLCEDYGCARNFFQGASGRVKDRSDVRQALACLLLNGFAHNLAGFWIYRAGSRNEDEAGSLYRLAIHR